MIEKGYFSSHAHCTALHTTANSSRALTLNITGVQVVIEPKALMTVIGTTMDWYEDPLRAEFVFHNPNAKGACGCGESFSV